MVENSTWQLFPGRFGLPDQAHVWRARLDPSHARLQEFRQTLSPAERSRAERFAFERDRRRFIARRGNLRAILGRYVGIAPERLEFEIGEWGKPRVRLPGATLLEFSQSHSGDIAVYAFSQAQPVGIDIESVQPFPDWESVGARFFSSQDLARWRSIPADQRTNAFFAAWTRTEASLKAAGGGLGQAKNTTTSPRLSEPESFISPRQDATQVCARRFTTFSPSPGFLASLATSGNHLSVQFFEFEIENATVG